MDLSQEQGDCLRPQDDRLANVSLVLGLDKRLHEAEVSTSFSMKSSRAEPLQVPADEKADRSARKAAGTLFVYVLVV
jgi:hypothetical protein